MSFGALPSETSATATGTSSQVLAANGRRQHLWIENRSATDSVYVRFGSAAVVATSRRIPPGGLLAASFNANSDEWLKLNVNAITSGASVGLAIIEVSS